MITVPFHALSIFGVQIYSSEFTFPTSEFANKRFHQNVTIEYQKDGDNFLIEYISDGRTTRSFINSERNSITPLILEILTRYYINLC